MKQTSIQAYTRKQYDKRRIPSLYFTDNYTVKNSILYLKGDEYSTYHWNYERMIYLIKKGLLSTEKPKL